MISFSVEQVIACRSTSACGTKRTCRRSRPLLSGSKNSYIATLVERHTRYVMLVKVANKDTQTVVSALIKQAKHRAPNQLGRGSAKVAHCSAALRGQNHRCRRRVLSWTVPADGLGSSEQTDLRR